MPQVYEELLEADQESQKNFSGHGSALAQVYNHMIMPLANSRDKRTQVIWGLKDFEYRFKRRPEGMWLSETAVDLETLDIMSEQGIKFAILAPLQAKQVRKINDKKWIDVSNEKIDPKMPYLCQLPSGGTINLFFYDGPISKDIAFGKLLNNGELFAKRLQNAFSQDRNSSQLVHIATDGESYGHYHRFGDMALAYALHYIESNNLARITNYGEYLELQPPEYEVEIFENSSWSCIHGVERWKSNCGCSTGMHPEWNQAWRAPLREAMDWLRNTLTPLYENELSAYVKDAWQIRNNYIEVMLDRSPQNVEQFFNHNAHRELSPEEKVVVLKLLEIQRQAMLMYTSCGWFFDDISGIETVQVMQHACRAMQLAEEITSTSLDQDYIKILERAPTNLAELKTGAEVYEIFVKPSIVDLLRFAAHFAVSSLFEDYPEIIKLLSYTAKSKIYDKEDLGMQRLCIGKARIHSDISWEENMVSYAVLHFGDHNLIGGVRKHMGDEPFSTMRQEIKNNFLKSDIAKVIRLMDKHFGTHNYSLWDLFRDEKRKILNQILEPTLKEIEDSYRRIYEYHLPIMQVMKEKRIPLPKTLAATVEFVVNLDLQKELEREELDIERLQDLVEETKKWALQLDKTTLGFLASQKINKLMERLSEIIGDISPLKTSEAVLRILEYVSLLETIEAVFRTLDELHLELDLWRAQNIYFAISKHFHSEMQKRAEKENQTAQKWVELFDKLGNYLNIKN